MLTLPARLEQIAEATPERVAVQQGERQHKYRELHEASLRFARTLRANGVAPGDRVAIVLPNGIDAVVAWYGTWRAGAAVVPLNMQARERDYYPWLRHSGARVLVHAPAHEDAASAAAAAEVPVLTAEPGTDPAAMSVDAVRHDARAAGD